MQVVKKQRKQGGKSSSVDTLQIGNNRLICSGKLLRTARIENEFIEDLENPDLVIHTLYKSGIKADIFTFWQRLPDTEPMYNYQTEQESIAAIPISTFDCWWKTQINSKTRNLLRKAEKMGVIVRKASYDENFINGMMGIFNETPIRQGKPFWHYGMTFSEVKLEFSESLWRQDLYGAYLNEDLIGFIFLLDAKKYLMLTQIISKIEHRDKAPNNALIAAAVQACEEKKIPYLVYSTWNEGSLAEFKKHNGFKKIDLPRYYCPLNIKGRIALKLNLHHGIKGIIPENLKIRLKAFRRGWYARKQTGVPKKQTLES